MTRVRLAVDRWRSRWQATETFVFPIEVRGVVITDAIGRAGRVQSLTEHEAVGLLKSQPLMELEAAHGSNGFEVIVNLETLTPILVNPLTWS